jgi:hypothetical protein
VRQEVAGFFGVTTSVVNNMANAKDLPKAKRYKIKVALI